MGVVYLAEQAKPVRRTVALKIIKPGMDTGQVIARFEAERQALALMDHPNIAKVLDAGATDTGRPYFVMELVKGVPITDYCDTVHLTPKERLELFIPVCQAIQHAHQKGIIHRDIKPSNVLVAMDDGKPVPKVIDFGVAKAIDQRLTERTLFTQHGAIVGTLEYMSPEQAELSGLDIDTRSDIYALGVLLYELLTGSTPLEKETVRQAAYAEILRRIREEEPPKPSTRLSESGDRLASLAAQRRTEPARLAKQVRGELDWIVMKALEKDRTRRYETANGFARDIQRYLDGDPVEAGPPSASYRLRKFARKHRAALVTAGAFAAVLLVAATVGTYLAVRATAAERLANRGWPRSSGPTPRPERWPRRPRPSRRPRALRQSEEAVRRRGGQQVPGRGVPQARPEPGRPRRSTVVDVLDRSRGEARLPSSPGRRRSRGSCSNALGETYLGLGLPARAAEVLDERPAPCGRRRSAPTTPTRSPAATTSPWPTAAAGRTAEAIALHEETLKLRDVEARPRPPRHARQPQQPRRRLPRRRSDGRGDRAARGDAQAADGEARPRPPRHAHQPQQPRRRLPGRRSDGRGDRAARGDAQAAGRQARARPPRHAHQPQQPRRRLPGRRADGRGDRAVRGDAQAAGSRSSGPTTPTRSPAATTSPRPTWPPAGRPRRSRCTRRRSSCRTPKLGPDHPDTLASRNNLAAAYLDAGRTAEAIATARGDAQAAGRPSSAPTTPTRSPAATTSPRPTSPPAGRPRRSRCTRRRSSSGQPSSAPTTPTRSPAATTSPPPTARRSPTAEAIRRARGIPRDEGPPSWASTTPTRSPPAQPRRCLPRPAEQVARPNPSAQISSRPAPRSAQTIPAPPGRWPGSAGSCSGRQKFAEAEPLLRECLAIREKETPRRLVPVQRPEPAGRGPARAGAVRRGRAAAGRGLRGPESPCRHDPVRRPGSAWPRRGADRPALSRAGPTRQGRRPAPPRRSRRDDARRSRRLRSLRSDPSGSARPDRVASTVVRGESPSRDSSDAAG